MNFSGIIEGMKREVRREREWSMAVGQKQEGAGKKRGGSDAYF